MIRKSIGFSLVISGEKQMFSRKDESEQTGAATGLEAGVASPGRFA